MCAGNVKDADADGGDVGDKEFLHHHGHVPAHALLCLHRGHLVRLRQVRLQLGQVRLLVCIFGLIQVEWYFVFKEPLQSGACRHDTSPQFSGQVHTGMRHLHSFLVRCTQA